MRYLIFILALLLLPAAGASAQDIPDTIPDTPEESPADRIRRQLTERYRQELAPLFVSAVTSAALPGSLGSAARDVMVYGGVQQLNRDAVYIGVGTRSFALDRDAARDILSGRRGTSTIFAAGYELALWRMAPGEPILRELHLGIGFGALVGDVQEVFGELHPTYQIRLGPRWTIPVGVRLGAMLTRATDVELSRVFVGGSIGLRLNLLQRDIMR